MSKVNIHTKLLEYYLRIDDNKSKDYEQMKIDAEELLKKAYQLDVQHGLAYAFIHLAIYYIAYRKFDSAEFNLKKAHAICEKNNFNDLLILCYRNEGVLCQLKGDNFGATNAYDATLAIAEEENDSATIGVLYNNMAYILMQLKDLEFAKDYFIKALDKVSKVDNQEMNILQIYLNLVRVSCDMDDVDGAREYYEKAKKIETENSYIKFMMITSLIRIYVLENNIDEIEKLLAFCKYKAEIFEGNKNIFISELIFLAESLLLTDLREECRSILTDLFDVIDNDDLHLKLSYQKLLVDFEEKYDEVRMETSANYYYSLMTREKQDNNSIAETLRNRIKLFEVSQKHSLLVRENENLEKEAHLDELTGLYNRRYCEKLLLKIESDKRFKTFGCIMIDVDHFKEYNDTYGHLIGDKILKLISSILESHAFDGISVGRYGGDEYYCLCSGKSDEEINGYLSAVLNDVRERNIAHIKNDSEIVTITAGFCNDDKSVIDINEIMKNADKALYFAKENGRNQFVNYKDIK
ncbi:GGDEF domain-containing protein [Anaerorhabdus sp.]|jgi:diguanylate cyclase (GGDEF)-like protein|uniref:GGDEF domain-containing protein n=1 Tax=Anaerorhabdus sp. TaxID=1872524 RepID=UPI002FC9B2C6